MILFRTSLLLSGLSLLLFGIVTVFLNLRVQAFVSKADA